MQRTGVNATPFTSTNVARLLAEVIPASISSIEWPELDQVLYSLDDRALAAIATNVMGRFDIIFECVLFDKQSG